MKPREYQETESDAILKTLRQYGLVYIAWEERTGKSLTGIRVVEKSTRKHCLIITKAKAKKGWHKTLLEYKREPGTVFEVITYGMISKYQGNPDIVILDEAHNYISGYPKPSKTWMNVKRVVFGLPIIYMSATPHAQGYQLLYHQFALSKWSPFKQYSTFYNWFKAYGKPYTIKAHGREVNQYDKVDDDKVRFCVDHLFHTKTRKELGFIHEPEDRHCTINLTDQTKKYYNTLLEDAVIGVCGEVLVADTVMKLRTSLHMMEGGTAKLTLPYKPKPNKHLLLVNREKIEDATLYHAYYDLGNREKVKYIKDHWGDTDYVAIMYNYKGEKEILEKEFQHAHILQATSNAEGVELAHIQHLVIYSQDFSTARHTQRRARQASKDREHKIYVHFLLVPKGISCQVYKTVSVNKQNYVDSRFYKETL